MVLQAPAAEDYQRRGLGGAIVSTLIERIEQAAPPGPFVSLFADPPGRRLYEQQGFVETAPGSGGMALRQR
jgi:GNAT superfamily N-acetyltransferase